MDRWIGRRSKNWDSEETEGHSRAGKTASWLLPTNVQTNFRRNRERRRLLSYVVDVSSSVGIRVTLKKVEWSEGGFETNVGGYRRRECPMIAIILLHWTLIVGTSEVQSWDGPQHCEWLLDASHILWGMCGKLVERLITFWRLIWLLTSQCLEDRILLMPEWTTRIYRFNVFFWIW